MNFIDKIHELQDQLKVKNKAPCPTPVLLFLAGGMVYPGRVDPWYSHIKEGELRGAPSYATEFFNAVICGMHPELEKATETLCNRLKEYQKENSHLYEDSRSQKNRRKNVKAYLQMTDNVMREFGLKEAYQVFEMTPEQRAQVNDKLKVAGIHYTDEILGECQPVIQLLGKAIQPEYMGSLESMLGFVQDMNSLDRRIKMDKDIYMKRSQNGYFNEPKIKGLVEQIWDLREKGILDDKFRVRYRYWQQFVKSDLVQKFTYDGKEFCLEGKLIEPVAAKAEEKGITKVDSNRSDLR